ncbi:MAG: long-chain fatty acid--CoA ligase [Desulfobulbus propionicus]|nr:MAG: long-chain fatty acid--CoA ligase [Desulfobulbus propionicus]
MTEDSRKRIKPAGNDDGQAEVIAADQYLPAVQDSATTLNELIDISCRRFRLLPAVGMALERPLTYKEMHIRILSLAAYLQDLGAKPGDKIALLSENSHYWGMVYLAIVRIGANVVPIFPDLPEADVHHILSEMKCDIIFITQRQIEKIYDLKKHLKKVVTLDDYLDDTGLISLVTFSDFLEEALGKYEKKAEEESLVFPKVSSDDLATVLYTSGTSGFSKAVMLSHANLCANAHACSKVMDVQQTWTFLSILPIAHTYEFTVGFLLPMVNGARVAYAGKAPTPAILQKICEMERPQVMLVVPLVIEKIFKKRVLPAVEKNMMLSFACRFKLGRKLVYKKIGIKLTSFFGGRMEIMGIGGAALNPDVESFLRDAKFPFLVGYGLTEASPLISGGPFGDKNISCGSVGKPVKGVEVRITDANTKDGIGSIEARGPNVMQGYLGDPEATMETITADGWLKTGDIGYLDRHGNLHVKGRLKSVIVMSNGENVYPEPIEHKVNSYPCVVESLVIENRGVLEAWIYPDYEFIDSKTAGQSRRERQHYIAGALEEIRVAVNEKLAPSSRLSRVLERREPFIKTATHKIKRYLYSSEIP